GQNKAKPKDGDKPNEGKGKSQGEPKDNEGQPKDGQPKDGQPKDGQPKQGRPSQGQPPEGDDQPKSPQPQQPQEEEAPGRKQVHATVLANEGQKATRNEDLKAGDLSGREGQIVIEANKALQLLEEDGTAVAIPQVLEQARDDMKAVQARLFKTDVGPVTQGIEEDIIAALKNLIAALKKAQQDLKDKKDQPPPPPSGKPPDPRLIDLLAEL